MKTTNKSLIELDQKYNKSIKSTFIELERSHRTILSEYKFDLSKTEISQAILERLKVYYLTQGQVKNFLNKRYLTAGADYFVETVLFFLRLYLCSQGGHLEAYSERPIKKHKNSIRPDISIWRQDEVVAIIECKTQLGWNRNNWEIDFIARDQKLKEDFPKAKTFLVVMTEENWSGFGINEGLNKKYFCLLKDIWANYYETESQIYTPIEGLFRQLTL